MRHVIFKIKDETAEADCAAYEPTGDLRKIARELIVGDSVEVYGAVHKATTTKPLTINLEKIRIINLQEKVQLENPLCPNCGKRLKSMGKNQGFRCEKCGGKFADLKKRNPNAANAKAWFVRNFDSFSAASYKASSTLWKGKRQR